jgi:hypothetical protein
MFLWVKSHYRGTDKVTLQSGLGPSYQSSFFFSGAKVVRLKIEHRYQALTNGTEEGHKKTAGYLSRNACLAHCS